MARRATGTVVRYTGWGAGVLLLVLLLTIVFFPWNWLKEPIASQVEKATGRKLVIAGDLDIDWFWPPSLHAEQIRFANAPWSDTPDMAEISRLDISISPFALLKGSVVIPQLALHEPRLVLEKNADGKTNWQFKKPEAKKKKAPLPEIRRLRITHGDVRFRDASKETDIQLQVNAGEANPQAAAVQVKGNGQLNGERFVLDLQGDSLLELYSTDQPYHLALTVRAEDTQLQLNGNIAEPLQLRGADLQMNIAGPDPARLSELLNVPIPRLPPYELEGHLQQDQQRWRLRQLKGRIGDSDIAGDIGVDLANDVPAIQGELSSSKLDFDDLGGLIGGQPGTGAGETAAPEQRAAKQEQKKQPRLLPDDPLKLQMLQNFNADVRYRAERILAGKLPLQALSIDFKVDDGAMRIVPLHFALASGTIDIEIAFDTRTQPSSGQLEAEFRNIDLHELLQTNEVTDASGGRIGGRAKLWLTGNSVSDMLASADGGLYLLMSGGYLDQLLVELAGLDAAESIGVLFSDKEEKVSIECAYADLQSKDGLVEIATLVFDTSDTLFFADGDINLKNEALDVVLYASPKDKSLVSARAPLNIKGTFKDISILPGASAFVRGATALLAAATAPLAAVLPLIETGPAEGEQNPLCQGLVQAMQTQTKEEQKVE